MKEGFVKFRLTDECYIIHNSGIYIGSLIAHYTQAYAIKLSDGWHYLYGVHISMDVFESLEECIKQFEEQITEIV